MWADRGSRVTYGARSSGSNGSERWQANAVGTSPSFAVSAPGTLTATYTDQLLETLAAGTASGGTRMSATNYIMANYAQFGGGQTAQIYDDHNASVWADRGSRVTYGAKSSGSNGSERWQANAAGTSPSFAVNASSTLAASYFDQLGLSVLSTHGVVSSRGTAFGSTVTNAGTHAFYDRGTTANAILQKGVVSEGWVTYAFVGWNGNATGNQLVSNNIAMNDSKTAIALWVAR